MKIFGIGTDIIEVHRVKNAIEKHPRFLEKIYTCKEISYCQSKKENKYQSFASRFAAKEAVWKALGKKDIWHRDITVKNTSDGKPEVILSKKYKSLQKRISLSLSHTQDYAVAVAIFDR